MATIETTSDRTPHRRGRLDFYSAERRAVRLMLPSRRKRARKKEKETSPRAFQSVYEIREIQFGGEFALNDPRWLVTWHSTRRASTRSVGMWNEPVHDGKLIWIHVGVKFPALTRASAALVGRAMLLFIVFSPLEILCDKSERLNANVQNLSSYLLFYQLMPRWCAKQHDINCHINAYKCNYKHAIMYI